MFCYMYLVYVITLVIVIFSYFILVLLYKYFSKLAVFNFVGKGTKNKVSFFLLSSSEKTKYVHLPRE